ncbi:MAG: aspartate-semialdehyde dehydrogenase [Elusimicrobia bacterium]|nr:aspartate-semialdehyde dehydrogenase [Elusimicrobiota bacterium]
MSGNDHVDVAVVGATGLVGRELLRVLEARRFPVGRLLAFNSGRRPAAVKFRGRSIAAQPVSLASLARARLVFMVSSDAVSKRWGRALAARGVWVIDDSAAFRLDPDVPLVIPEVNAGALGPGNRLIAGPNCTLTGAAVAGWPLIRRAGAAAVRLASYQAVSGAGREALEEFRGQVRAAAPALRGGDALAPPPRTRASALPRPIAFNVFPQVGSFNGDGESSEEVKVRRELRKLWSLPKLPVSVTAVRVPVVRGHGLAFWLETRRRLSPSAALRLLRGAPGVELWKEGNYPTPLGVGGSWPVHVARIRPGASARELALWIVSDNLLKGAALNSAQIAEVLLAKGWL